MHTKELIDFIIKQELPDVKYYPELAPLISMHFKIVRRDIPDKECHRQLIADVIEWENGYQNASLEETINRKYIVEIRDSPKVPVGGDAVPDQFIDKHLAKVMELTIDSYISTHIEKMHGGLEMASIKHFVETGKVNGSFHIRLKEMMMEFAKQWGKTANRLSTPHSSEGMAEALRGIAHQLESDVQEEKYVVDNAGLYHPNDVLKASVIYHCTMNVVNKLLASLSPGVEDGSGWVKGGKEYIVCAAIQCFVDDKEVIVCGLRHNNCISTYYNLTGKQTNTELEQGFLTSKGRFVNRIEAGEIALSCGQIKEMKYYGGKMLDSSDLYHSSHLPTPPGVEDNQTKKQ